eukprot:UN24280
MDGETVQDLNEGINCEKYFIHIIYFIYFIFLLRLLLVEYLCWTIRIWKITVQ